MNNYVVIARFDEGTDKKITDLQGLLKDAGYSISEWPPHITIAAYENLDKKLLCEWTAAFSSKNKRQKIDLNSLSILPPCVGNEKTAVLCLNPAHSKAFVDFYYAFHAKYEEHCTGIGQFNSILNSNPSIHATIGVIETMRLQDAMELAFSGDIFGAAEITALEVYTYPMELIERFELE